MKRKFLTIGIAIIIIILLACTLSNATVMKLQSTNFFKNENVNQQINLGSASIIGNGNSSILEASAKNDLLIGIDAEISKVDFYIDYNMNCDGATDEGVITLTIFINDENNSFNLVQTPASKNGTLKIENVEVHRQDTLLFVINVVYGSIIPLYSNSTSSTGVGVFSKSAHVIGVSNVFFIRWMERHPYMFPLLRQLLEIEV